MHRRMRERAGYLGVSGIVVVILGAQAFAGFTDRGRNAWPIVAYGMYSVPHYAGDRLDEFTIYAVSSDGGRREVTPGDLEMGWWLFRKNVVNPVRRGREERLAATMAQLCRDGTAPTRLEAVDTGIEISAAGPVADPEPGVARAVEVNCPSGGERSG